MLMCRMEAMGAGRVPGDYLDCLKETHSRETSRLVALTKILIEAHASIHEKEGHVTMMDL
ncbi:hypothetical protein Tco_1367210, partial [Tanacetum coccineum]